MNPKKPSVLERNVKINIGQLLKGLAGLWVSGAKLYSNPFDLITWGDAVQQGGDAISSIKLEKLSPEELAYVLILKSILVALLRVALQVDPLCDQIEEMDIERLDSLKEITIDDAFFEAPGKTRFIQDAKIVLQDWLDRNVDSDRKEKIAPGVNCLPVLFTSALFAEWDQNRTCYGQTLRIDGNPFSEAKEDYRQWCEYYKRLENRLDEAIFGEPTSLRELYVPLNAWQLDDQNTKCVVAVEKALTDWLETPNDSIRFISGGPGSGKSSITRILASDIARKGTRPVILIPLYDFNISTSNFIGEFANYLKRKSFLIKNPIDPRSFEDDVLIIFDGLDELEEQGGNVFNAVQNFVEYITATFLQDTLELHPNVKVLFSGREPAAEAAVKVAQHYGGISSKHVLHLLPYYVENQFDYFDPERLLKTDLREIWWGQFLSDPEREKKYDHLRKSVKNDSLKEITIQPLLNYLYVLSQKNTPPDSSQELTRNQIYHSLICGTFERKHEARAMQPGVHKGAKALTQDAFCMLLEDIALAAWNSGETRTIAVDEIEKFLQNHNKDELGTFSKFVEREKENQFSRLFVSFFFRRHDSLQDETSPRFVFTHKTFSEYLIARGIVRSFRRLISDFKKSKSPLQEEAFQRWMVVASAVPLSRDIYKFVSGEVELIKNEYFEKENPTVRDILIHCIQDGIPLSRDCFRGNLNSVGVRKACACVEGTLLALANLFADRNKGSFSPFSEEACLGFKLWFSSINALYAELLTDAWSLVHCLNGLNLCGVDLESVNLTGAYLVRANLMETNLARANLMRANLARANLTRANLWGAYLAKAYLEGAYLAKAYLVGADLRGADLRKANLREANLVGADLRGAYLRGANLREANLREADLLNANLEGANLLNVNLEGAQFTREGLTRQQIKYIKKSGGIVK